MASKYHLLFKTAQAEFRTWEKISATAKKHVFPIVELTRGRKKPKSGKGIPEDHWRTTPNIYDFTSVIERANTLFADSEQIILDLTREEQLSCYEIDTLASSSDGYQAWVNFISLQTDKYRDVIPTLIINPAENEDEDEYKSNLQAQLAELLKLATGAAYRASAALDPDFLYDLIVLKDSINEHIENGKQFWVLLDHEFIRPGTGILHASRTVPLIEKILELIPKVQIVCIATSFPKSIEDLGEPDHDSFPTEEVYLFEEISTQLGSDTACLYGDYGSINPIRNDLVGRGGWRPRIDFPTSTKKTFYYREKRSEGRNGVMTTYASHYVSVANKVIHDSLYEKITGSWGVKQIESAAAGAPPGKAPSFWISVRMEIHILQQLRRMNLI